MLTMQLGSQQVSTALNSTAVHRAKAFSRDAEEHVHRSVVSWTKSNRAYGMQALGCRPFRSAGAGTLASWRICVDAVDAQHFCDPITITAGTRSRSIPQLPSVQCAARQTQEPDAPPSRRTALQAAAAVVAAAVSGR